MGSELNDGRPIESGHYSSSHVPADAFDGNNSTLWGGDGDEDGLFWLGMEFNVYATINCVSILDISGRGVTELRVQAWQSSTATWQNALISKDLQSGQRKNITLSQRTNIISHCPQGFELRHSVCTDNTITKSNLGLVVGIIVTLVALVVISMYISWKKKTCIYFWCRQIRKSLNDRQTSNLQVSAADDIATSRPHLSSPSLGIPIDTNNTPSPSAPSFDNADEATECVICLANKKNVLFLPCRHMCTCQDCSTDTNIDKCPMCRESIEDRIIVFN